MSTETIYYLAITNLIDRKIVVDYFPPGQKDKINKYHQKAKEIVDRLILISITANERYSESINEDTKIITSVDKSTRWCFMSIVISNYPERVGYKMLSDLEDNSLYDLNKNYLDKIGEDESLISSGFKSIGDNIKLYMVELYQKYRNIGSVDQIRAIQNDVDEIKTDMKKNMNNMLLNLEIVSNLEHKTDALKEQAKEYKKNAKELKKITWWNNKKITIAVGGVGIAAILFTVFKFVL